MTIATPTSPTRSSNDWARRCEISSRTSNTAQMAGLSRVDAASSRSESTFKNSAAPTMARTQPAANAEMASTLASTP